MIHRRGEYTLDVVHLLWTGALFWTLILNWWVFFESREMEVWSFDYFFVVVVWAVLFFLMAVVLFPPDMAEDEDYSVVFERNRLWFLGLFIASSLSDILMTAMRGDLFDPPFYLPFAGHFIVLGVIESCRIGVEQHALALNPQVELNFVRQLPHAQRFVADNFAPGVQEGVVFHKAETGTHELYAELPALHHGLVLDNLNERSKPASLLAQFPVVAEYPERDHSDRQHDADDRDNHENLDQRKCPA